MAGILSKPPALTRVSPGVYRDAKGKVVRSTTGKAPVARAPAAAKPAASTPAAPAAQALPHLTAQQNEVINQTQGGDIALGNIAQQQVDDVQKAYEQPFQFQGPAAPVTGDYNNWVQQQMGNYNQAFDQRYNPVFQQQSTDFDQQMANRGIPVGSELYNNQKNLMMQSQNDARTQAYAANQSNAIQSAAQLYGVGSDAHQNAFNESLQMRNMPLNEYSALMASRSGQQAQNLAHSQQFQLQNDQQKAQMQLMKATPRGGGGGGGGGAMWQQMGFASPQEYAAWEDARQINLYNATKGQQSGGGGPSYGSQLIGAAGGILLNSALS